MRLALFLVFSLSHLSALFSPVQAQSIGNGRLLIDTPNAPLTCEAATVDWIWTGSSYDAQTNTVSVAVEREDISRRALLAEPSPIRFIRKRAAVWKPLHSRGNAINIAGGSSIPMSVGTWTWNSVGVPVGTYRIALTIDGEGTTAFSNLFTVREGPDTSCLGSLASDYTPTSVSSPTSESTSADSAINTSVPGTSSETNNSAASPTASPASSTTLPSSSTAAQSATESDKSSGSGGISSGSIAAAVIVPLLVVAVLLWLVCMRRKKATTKETPAWSEKFAGFFAGSSAAGSSHRRQISGPMDPVHAAGRAMHEHAVKTQIRQAGNDASSKETGVTKAPEHWVDFQPEMQEKDAHLVTPAQVDEMVRVSMEAGRDGDGTTTQFYQQGKNDALRESGVTDTSSLPSYLRDADFESRHTHSSFGHEANGSPVLGDTSYVQLERSPTQKSGLERSESKVRRKPVPTYRSSTTAETDEADSSEPETEVHGPFSDAHEAIEVAGNHASTTSSATVIQDDRLREMLANTDEEVMLDSPTLPFARTPPTNSSRFPVSVHSSVAGSPAQRILLDMPRESLTEEQRKEVYKLSVQIPNEDRGFRVSF